MIKCVFFNKIIQKMAKYFLKENQKIHRAFLYKMSNICLIVKSIWKQYILLINSKISFSIPNGLKTTKYLK